MEPKKEKLAYIQWLRVFAAAAVIIAHHIHADMPAAFPAALLPKQGGEALAAVEG